MHVGRMPVYICPITIQYRCMHKNHFCLNTDNFTCLKYPLEQSKKSLLIIYAKKLYRGNIPRQIAVSTESKQGGVHVAFPYGLGSNKFGTISQFPCVCTSHDLGIFRLKTQFKVFFVINHRIIIQKTFIYE